MNDPKNDAAKLALTVVQRFIGPQPDALERVRDQVRAELEAVSGQAQRLRAELDALETLLRMSAEEAEEAASPRVQMAIYAPLPLRRAILAVLGSSDESWSTEELMRELTRRGWEPGGKNPKNTLISRLSEMKSQGVIARDRNGFRLPVPQEEGAPAV